jgi:hypothetical protein
MIKLRTARCFGKVALETVINNIENFSSKLPSTAIKILMFVYSIYTGNLRVTDSCSPCMLDATALVRYAFWWQTAEP